MHVATFSSRTHSLAWRQSAFLLTLAAATAFVALRPRVSRPRPTSAVPNEWRVPDLVARLRARGFTARAVPVPDGPAPRCVFFCADDRPADGLCLLTRDVRCAERWRGLVFCERCRRPEELGDEVAASGEHGFVAGPFVFFGDPGLLAQIRAALGVDEGPGVWSRRDGRQ